MVWFPKQARTKDGRQIETVRIWQRRPVMPSVPNVAGRVKDYEDSKDWREPGFGPIWCSIRLLAGRCATRLLYQVEATSAVRIRIRRRGRYQDHGSAIDWSRLGPSRCATKEGNDRGPAGDRASLALRTWTPLSRRLVWLMKSVDGLSAPRRQKAREADFINSGETVRKEGYRGYFELDFLSTKRPETLAGARLNPPASQATSSMTNTRLCARDARCSHPL